MTNAPYALKPCGACSLDCPTIPTIGIESSCKKLALHLNKELHITPEAHPLSYLDLLAVIVQLTFIKRESFRVKYIEHEKAGALLNEWTREWVMDSDEKKKVIPDFAFGRPIGEASDQMPKQPGKNRGTS